MALKGAIVKEEVSKKILEIFEGSFKYDKEIRIPMVENGEMVQLKCVLTCAKTNVEPNGDTAIPGMVNNAINFNEQAKTIEVTQEEKDNVARLAKMLNL